MPLTPPAGRTSRHLRTIQFEAFERDDGLWDIEGTLTDTKTSRAFVVKGERTWQPGEPIHQMTVRVTITTRLVVQAAELTMDHIPHAECLQATAPMDRLVGCSMGPGWRRQVQERLGELQGCAHARELLVGMGTAAIQALTQELDGARFKKPPRPMGQCVSWDPSGTMVRRLYPMFYVPRDE